MNGRKKINPSQPGPSLVSFRRVSRFYKPEKPALFDISFDIYPGEFIYVAGTSGAGKSTLMRLLHAGEKPDTGAVFFGGHEITRLRRSAIAVLRRSMGVVFQDFLLIPDLTVTSNVGLPLEISGFSRTEIEQRTADMLQHVGLGGRGGELAGDLSGGEQQRVAIARALIGQPELILADEPTGSLDAYNADFILDLLEKTTSRGTTVILATHDRMLMAARPHRTLALEQGRMVGMSPKEPQTPCDNKAAEIQQTA